MCGRQSGERGSPFPSTRAEGRGLNRLRCNLKNYSRPTPYVPATTFAFSSSNFPLNLWYTYGWISIFSNSSTARENTRMILIFFAKVLVLKISRNCLIENLESLFGVNLIWIGFSLRASRFTAGV